MRLLGKLGLAAAACLLWANAAAVDTTVKWLHIEANPVQVKIWEEVARADEASHPGVKAKLPTILQSRDRPNIIYSWAGGVLKTQIEAGVLEETVSSAAFAMVKTAPKII
jgi:raffinose/stachyose/melibiose transport system substrate-binding protein